MRKNILVSNETCPQILEKLDQKDLALDTETTGINPFRSDLVGVSLSDGEESYYFPIAHQTGNNLDYGNQVCLRVFLDKQVGFLFHNGKYDFHILRRWSEGRLRVRILQDSYLMAVMLDREEANLKFLARTILGETPKELKDLFPAGTKDLNFSKISPEEGFEYACDDARNTFNLTHKLFDLIKEKYLGDIYDMELNFLANLLEIETEGLRVDRELLEKKNEEYLQLIGQKGIEFWDMVNWRLINSDKPETKSIPMTSNAGLSKLLYDKLGYKCMKVTDKGGRSVSEDALDLLPQDELISTLRELKSMVNVQHNYLDRVGDYVINGRIYPNWKQIGESGRVYSSDPSVTQFPWLVREAIYPDEGTYFIVGDYKSQEYRVAAVFSGEPYLLNAFEKGEDLHIKTFCELTGKRPEEVTEKDREMGKVFNYGLIFGMDKYGLARRLLISGDKAQDLLNNFFIRMPRLVEWRKKMVEECHKTTYTKTYFGRRRWLPAIKSEKKFSVERAERQVINTAIQGTGADILKTVINKICKWAKDSKQDYKVKVFVFDSIVVQVPCHVDEKAVLRELKVLAELELGGVKFPMNWKVCRKSWGEAHDKKSKALSTV